MRKLFAILAVVAILAGALAIYLVVSIPRQSAGVRFPLTPRQRALLGRVPASADTFAFIPAAAALETRLSANAVTRRWLQEWRKDQLLPSRWVFGDADLVVWRSGRQTTLLPRLDPVRRLVARTYMMFSAASDDGGRTRLVLDPEEEPIASADLDRLLQMAAALPPGDALVVQREGGRGAYPPMPRPAVSSLRVTPTDIFVTSRAPRSGEPAATMPLQVRFARSSILTTAFAVPSRLIEDMNRLVGARASTLLRDGGAIVLFDVDTDKLLPRPREVIVLPSTPERRAALQEFVAHAVPDPLRQLTGFHIESADTGSELLVAFERASIDRYLKDGFEPVTISANAWAVRLDPRRAIPMLQQVGATPGLRYIAPRIFRSVRDLGGWIEHLEAARSVEAGDTVDASVETLIVRIGS